METERVREQRNICAVFAANGCFCLSVLPHFLEIRCAYVPATYVPVTSSSDPTDLAELFSICFRNSLASTKMNLLA